jgi:hypothetical protein
MIQNKSPRINLSLFTAFGLFTVVACSSSPEQPESAKPVVDSPPPEEVLRSEPIDNSEAIPAAPEPDMPAASPIREGIPDRYVVKKGDTLWDISSHFLKDPWLWPEVWHVNPEIRNPHLIYPGDVIALTWRDGKPSISIVGAEGEPPPPPPRTDLTTVKLSPSAREEKLRRAIDTIPKSAISAFLTRPYILDNATLNSAPFIVSNYGDYIISGRGAKIYARPLLDADNINFNVVRKGRKYIDPDSGEFLGYEAVNLGQARLLKLGDPATLTVTKAYKEILKGDLLVPVETEEVDLNFFPRAPENDVAGRIISVAEGVQKIGQYNIVVINKGSADGLEPGHVLEIHQQGALVRSPRGRYRIRLPEERAGLLMIFKPYEDVSYGLVMEAFTDLTLYDYVYSP